MRPLTLSSPLCVVEEVRGCNLTANAACSLASAKREGAFQVACAALDSVAQFARFLCERWCQVRPKGGEMIGRQQTVELKEATVSSFHTKGR